MSSPQDEGVTVKNAISTQSADYATVTLLQKLLSSPGLSGHTRSASSTRPTTALSTRRAPSGHARSKSVLTGNAKNVKSKSGFEILEDGVKPLSPRSQYALATDVINLSLKILGDAAKAANLLADKKSPEPEALDAQLTRGAQRRAGTPGAQVALKERSGNAVQDAPRVPHTKASQSLQCPRKTGEVAVNATADCARCAFYFLRGIDTKDLGMKERPFLQLEVGALALISRLLSLGLVQHGLHELLSVKQILDADATPRKPMENRPFLNKTSESAMTCEKVADLLHLRLDDKTVAEALSLAVSYQSLVLQAMNADRRPGTIEHALPYMSCTLNGSPVDTVSKQARCVPDSTRTTKQLESLSRAVLKLCPSTSESADELALNRDMNPSPSCVFSLQTHALRIRQEMWQFTGQPSNVEKDIKEPLARCLSAFSRRMDGAHLGRYKIAKEAYRHLRMEDYKTSNIFSNAILTIHRLLSLLAEAAECYDEAYDWAVAAIYDCSTIERTHASHLAVLVRKAAVLQSMETSGNVRDHRNGQLDMMETISQLLGGKLDGNSQDYAPLLVELHHLVSNIIALHGRQLPEDLRKLSLQVATFAMRYARSYPGKSDGTVLSIAKLALSLSLSNEDLNSWVTKDTADILLRTGCLSNVAESASTQPLSQAWSSSKTALSLSRVLKTLVLKAASVLDDYNMERLFDNKQLPDEQRAVVLEWELVCALDVAYKSKYRNALQVIVPALIERLLTLYEVEAYPLRRARVLTCVSRAAEMHPDFIKSDLLASFSSSLILENQDLSQDAGLRSYATDIRNSSAVAKLLRTGQISFVAVQPCLRAWYSLLKEMDERKLSVNRVLDDPSSLASQLMSLDDYFEMLGNQEHCVQVSLLLVRLCSSSYFSPSDLCNALLRTFRAYSTLGYLEKGLSFLDQAKRTMEGVRGGKELLHLQLCVAESHLLRDDLEECRTALDDAQVVRASPPHSELSASQRRSYISLHAKAWLLHSSYLMRTARPGEALRDAKRAVKILNSIWTDLGRTLGPNASRGSYNLSPDDAAMGGLTNGIKKLNLKPNSKDAVPPEPSASTKAAVFWHAAPLMCHALLHLADLYKHHGIFKEADYYSQESLRIADCVDSPGLRANANQHRCALLTSAGLVEDAEICLAHENEELRRLQLVRMLMAKAGLRTKTGSTQEALESLDEAKRVLNTLQYETYVESLASLLQSSAAEVDILQPKSSELRPRGVAAQTKSSRAYSTRKSKTSPKLNATAKSPAQNANGVTRDSSLDSGKKPTYLMFQNILAQILIQQAFIALKMNLSIDGILDELQRVDKLSNVPLACGELNCQVALEEILKICASDFTLSAAIESTLFVPALSSSTEEGNQVDKLKSVNLKAVPQQTTGRQRLSQGISEQRRIFQNLARSLQIYSKEQRNQSERMQSTMAMHREHACMTSISMLLSNFTISHAANCPALVCEAALIDRPLSYAFQSFTNVTVFEDDNRLKGDIYDWPTHTHTSDLGDPVTPSMFQHEYVDIIPKRWAAVSMTLSESCKELYLTKYRSGKRPLILRLPFSRDKSEDALEEEGFDFQAGKAELQDIIERSNVSCHSFADNGVKGTKTKWWNEREALDKQLHELLLSMENIWLGGFKGVFTENRFEQEPLDKFRRDIEMTLSRHLPSRQSSKRPSVRPRLDDQVLELFIGLGSDKDGEYDLDEPLTDLLYFVVETLQLHGEFNAFDEVDFDAMVVEVLDALRDYHEEIPEEDCSDSHLILILDRRLQMFPWESMPCLDGASVSRLDSMLTLRQRILAMRRQMQDSSSLADRYIVPQGSGTYILNPGSDLKNTETVLGPMLSSLPQCGTSKWQGIVGRAPTEQDFSSALSEASTLLYFGHGSGAQYIRPRAIRRLDSCSQVVWLMGCSSGAVTEYDELEPSAVPMAYMVAGQTSMRRSVEDKTDNSDDKICMAVLATLWDVTDKDIDRFSLNVGQKWGLWSSSPSLPATSRSQGLSAPTAAMKTPAKKKTRNVFMEPTTPKQAPKTPKTPRVQQTPAGEYKSARDRSLSLSGDDVGDDPGKQSLVAAVAKSRDACYLRYLNGAAPVVYGIPVYLGQ